MSILIVIVLAVNCPLRLYTVSKRVFTFYIVSKVPLSVLFEVADKGTMTPEPISVEDLNSQLPPELKSRRALTAQLSSRFSSEGVHLPSRLV